MWSLLALSLLPRGDTVDFTTQIRPLLSDRCFICHGPDADARESDLRLDTRTGATAEIDDGFAIVPFKPEESTLLERLRHPRPRKRMPPPESKLSLSTSEIDLIECWILEGAEYEEHWAFVPPQRQEPPGVVNADWPRDELDRFVLAKLEAEGLTPAAPADRATWLRRVSFDLTGLPPTLLELDEFLDDDSELAFERVVDRLLASPRYGERMASDWLDAARYADSYGYQSDVARRVWPWRDWVIDAFNRDLAWDEFVTWQVAGDLMPEATREQKLATAFNRLHRQTNEGGSVEEEYRVEYVADRTHTFGTAFLGLTMECARCHDHKYDPLSQEEYFGLFAFFDDIDESGLYSHFTNAVPTPTLWLPTEEQERELARLKQERDDAEQALIDCVESQEGEIASFLGRCAEQEVVTESVVRFDFEDVGEEKHTQTLYEQLLNGGAQLVAGRGGNVLRLTGEDSATFKGSDGTGELGAFTRDDPFTIALWMKVPDFKDRAVVFHRSQAWTDSGSRGYQLLIEDGRLSASLIHFWPGNAIRVHAVDPLPVGEWVHVAMGYDGSSRAGGLTIWMNGQEVTTDVVRDNLTRSIQQGTLTIGQRFRDRGLAGGEVDDFTVFDHRASRLEIQSLLGTLEPNEDGEAGTQVFREDLPKFGRDQDDDREHYETNLNLEIAKKRQALHDARRAYSALVDKIPEIMVMEELAEPRVARFLERGSYLSPSHAVEPHTPASVLALDADAEPDRLGLARWLLDERHPLFARVSVNRYWQLLFGTGLVASSENFGSQGDIPVHQPLLDYLTYELRDGGWSIKGLLRRIALSATYRQSSTASAELRERDPRNRLLARGPRTALTAEMIRDNALFISGLLVEKVGGPPVKPYQPPGLWQEKSGAVYKADEGEGLWRRSLYSFWKRTSPPPSMMIFDAASRDVCVVKRQSTSSPLQALALWNDPQQVEAARLLSQRVVSDSAASDSDRLQSMFRLCTSHFPGAEELAALGELLTRARDAFSSGTEEMGAWLGIGKATIDESLDPVELAAFAVVANTLLGYDGTLTLR